jgi:plastocyanin
VKRLIVVATLVAALGGTAVAVAATTLTNPASKTKLAYAKKALAAPKGKITLKMPNPSVLPHNIALRKGVGAKGAAIVKGQIVPKGKTSKVTATLKAGKYRFFCSVPGHEAGGMWGILTVK